VAFALIRVRHQVVGADRHSLHASLRLAEQVVPAAQLGPLGVRIPSAFLT